MAPNHGVSLKAYPAFPLVEFDEAGGNLEKASPRGRGHTHVSLDSPYSFTLTSRWELAEILQLAQGPSGEDSRDPLPTTPSSPYPKHTFSGHSSPEGHQSHSWLRGVSEDRPSGQRPTPGREKPKEGRRYDRINKPDKGGGGD